MRSMRTVLILRGLMTVLVASLAVVAFASGRVVVGGLLAAVAVTKTVLIVVVARRHQEFARRFPHAAARRQSGDPRGVSS